MNPTRPTLALRSPARAAGTALALLVLALLALASSCATPRERERARERERPPTPYVEPPPLVIVKKPADRPPEPPPPPPPDPANPAKVEPPDAAGPGGGIATGIRDPKSTMSVHLLDIGQGAATLIELPCGAILVDTGGEKNESFNSVPALLEQLDAFFKRRTDLKRTIDLLVITHPHIDHVRGVPDLVTNYTVKNVVDGGMEGEKNVRKQMDALRDFIATHKPGYRAIESGSIDAKTGLTDAVVDPLKCKTVDPVVRVLGGRHDSDPGWGEDNYGKRRFDNANNHSIVLRVDFGKSSILITGDLEEAAIRGMIDKYRGTKLLDVDLYQAGHHGSANGTTPEMMSAMTPKIAVIQMGPASRHHSWTAWAYGHPRETVVRMLEGGVSMTRVPRDVEIGTKVKGFLSVQMARAVYGTGWDGAFTVDMAADGAVSVRVKPKANDAQ